MKWLDNFKKLFATKEEKEAIESNPHIQGSKDLTFKIGTTSGLYGIARSEELADIIRKLSYTLTRGASCIELAADVPHEVNYTMGKELRYIAKSQGIDITFHGSLTVPMAIPETTEWNTAQEHIQKSIKSAIHAGAKYIDFHSCLKEWLELFTYASSRLHIVMSDTKGNFIGELFKGNEKLTRWFVNESKYRFWSAFGPVIVGNELQLRVETELDNRMNSIFDEKEVRNKIKENIKQALLRRIRAGDSNIIDPIASELIEKNIIRRGISLNELIPAAEQNLENTDYFQNSVDQNIRDMKRLPSYYSKIGELTRNEVYGPNTDTKIRRMVEDQREKTIKEEIFQKLIQSGDWYEKERTGATLEMAYYIIAHNMYIKSCNPEGQKNPLWEQMVELYLEDLKRLNYQCYDPEREDNYDPEKHEPESRLNWLEKTLLEINENPDKELIRTFKEFYYGVVASKFLQDHMLETFRWMNEDLPDILEREVKMTESNPEEVLEQIEELKNIIKKFAIAIENPDARDPSQAGRFLLWRPKQIYLAIDILRKKIKENPQNNPEIKKIKDFWDKTYMLIDFEHLATQGVDPLQELRSMLLHPMTNEYGKIVKTVHAGVPTPLHSHKPIKAVDRMKVYELLWELKQAGLGSETRTYLIFERGGFQKPYGGSVRVLRMMSKLLQRGTHPDDVAERFFVIPKPQNVAKQRDIIFEHMMDPVEGLLKFPEESYTSLSSTAMKGGAKPEKWAKERYQ